MAFKYIQYAGQEGPLQQVESNIIWYLRDKLLEIGAYYNISSGTIGYDGNDWHKLRPSFQPGKSNFSFWSGRSHQWVWESGVNLSFNGGSQPIRPSGVYINGLFYSTASTTGNFAHHIDYQKGGVQFSGSLNQTLDVRCSRSERAVFVYPQESDEYRKLTSDWLRSRINTPGSGLDNYPMEYKAFLPAVFIDIDDPKTKPYELGSSSKFNNFRVNFDIFAENDAEFKRLRDICYGLEMITIPMFDVNEVSASGDWPLKYNGSLTNDAKMRSVLESVYPYRIGPTQINGQFIETTVSSQKFKPFLPIYRGRVSIDFQIIL